MEMNVIWSEKDDPGTLNLYSINAMESYCLGDKQLIHKYMTMNDILEGPKIIKRVDQRNSINTNTKLLFLMQKGCTKTENT